MRTFDQPIPAVTPGPRPPRLPGWAVDLYIAIERLPTAAHHWDDYVAAWDDPDDAFLWDAIDSTETFVDATCNWSGLEIEVGSDDPEGRIDAARLVLTLDNASGVWSQYDAFGRLIAYEPGSRIAVWTVDDDDEPWWVYSGEIASWREQPDATVEVEAFDGASDLNESIGTWIPGAAGQLPHVRIGAILDLVASTAPRRLDVGQVTLHAYPTTATPWEELQAVASSDGGLIGFDVDGTVIFRNRGWVGGRADQTEIRAFSDNVCTVPHNVWDLELVTDDEITVTDLELTNVEGLAVRATAAAPRRFSQTRSGDQWISTLDGQALADAIVARRSQPYVRVERFVLHLTDPQQDLWTAGIDLRLGDLVRLLHDQPALDGPQRVDLNHVVALIHHDITPDAWLVEVATSRAVGNNVTWRWDGPGLAWDQPPAEWSY